MRSCGHVRVHVCVFVSVERKGEKEAQLLFNVTLSVLMEPSLGFVDDFHRKPTVPGLMTYNAISVAISAQQ